MQIEVGGGIVHKMAVILGVVAPIKAKKALLESAMDVAGLIGGFIFAKDQHIGLNLSFSEGRCLAHEAPNGAVVALGEHAGHGVPFGRKLEEIKVILFVLHSAGGGRHGRGIDGRILVFIGISDQLKILEGKSFAKIEFSLGLRVGGSPSYIWSQISTPSAASAIS